MPFVRVSSDNSSVNSVSEYVIFFYYINHQLSKLLPLDEEESTERYSDSSVGSITGNIHSFVIYFHHELSKLLPFVEEWST